MQMKNKHKILSVFLFLCLIFSMSALVSAKWQTTSDGSKYYTVNGKKVTGLKTINRKKYLFNAKGNLVTDGVYSYKGKLYVCQKDGSILTSWGKYKGKNYYPSSTGALRTGLCNYKNSLYYFNTKNGAMVKKAWQRVGKKYYYFSSTGKAYRNGIKTIGKKSYLFGPKGVRQSGLKKINNHIYLFSSKTGEMQLGTVKYKGHYYYFSRNTGRAYTNQWRYMKYSDGNHYYYDYQGHRQTGWLVLGSKKYYLDPAKDGARTYGTKRINGKTYNFGTKGYVSYAPSSNNIVVKVNRKACVITVYDNNIPIKAMTCSVGRKGNETPTGSFVVQDHHAWWYLDGPSLGQYCSHFLSEYLFHSVPMHGSPLNRNPYKVSSSDFNKLGQPASGGCIRLCIADAKWIYYNVPVGSTVIISDHEATPLGKPKMVKMPKNTVGADPTDDFKNPAGYDVNIRK